MCVNYAYMDNESYYSKNKQSRKNYQKQYYANNRDRIRRKRMMEELEDPEKFEARKAYNRTYYQQNKDRILKKRAELYISRRKSAES